MPTSSLMFARLLAGSAVALGAYSCPGSPSFIHASAKVTALAATPCEDVQQEISARIGGQFDRWHDPHNNGTYSTLAPPSATEFELQRITGNKKYTDKLNIILQPTGPDAGSCTIMACSESQTTSVADFGTNYCNMRMLYCGSADGCKPVSHDFTSTEKAVSTSSPAAQHDLSLCLKV